MNYGLHLNPGEVQRGLSMLLLMDILLISQVSKKYTC